MTTRQKRAAVRALAAVAASGLLVACDPPIVENTLTLTGTLDRDAVFGDDRRAIPVDFEGDEARGEWWPCDLRLTSSACIDAHHVNVYLALPQVQDLDGLGQSACIDAEGNAFGVYELLQAKRESGDPIAIPEDLTAFVLVASDVDGDGSADLQDDAETGAASRVASGELTLTRFGAFTDALTLSIEGKTSSDRSIAVAFAGSMTAATTVPPLDEARTCPAN